MEGIHLYTSGDRLYVVDMSNILLPNKELVLVPTFEHPTHEGSLLPSDIQHKPFNVGDIVAETIYKDGKSLVLGSTKTLKIDAVKPIPYKQYQAAIHKYSREMDERNRKVGEINQRKAQELLEATQKIDKEKNDEIAAIHEPYLAELLE
ncbi:MAG: hypothetical protein ACE5FT_06710 [Candidatus Nanoarchaeia archaeon]